MQYLKPKKHIGHGIFLAIGGTKCAVDNHIQLKWYNWI